ncbi:MAG TPA: hypothetical protein VIM89_22980 [Mucilaginibacter sp.]
MKVFLLLFISLLCFGCNKRVHRKGEITKIEFARDGLSITPGVTIGIDETLDYKYFGNYESQHQKYLVGKVSSQFWDTLTRKLHAIKFKTVKATIDPLDESEEYYELIVYWTNGKRRLLRVWSKEPDPVLSLCEWIDTSYKKVKLHKANGIIKFETLHHSIAEPIPDTVWGQK